MKTIDLDKRSWVVLVASCLINLCIGSIYAWSVFAAPLAAKLTSLLGTTFTAADLAIVFTVANSIGPVTMICGGFITDKFGPRNNSVNYGIMFIGFAVAGYFGPTVCGRILASTGAYGTAFVVSIALAVVGILLSVVFKKLRQA